jgi:hypothetical protein
VGCEGGALFEQMRNDHPLERRVSQVHVTQ